MLIRDRILIEMKNGKLSQQWQMISDLTLEGLRINVSAIERYKHSEKNSSTTECCKEKCFIKYRR